VEAELIRETGESRKSAQRTSRSQPTQSDRPGYRGGSARVAVVPRRLHRGRARRPRCPGRVGAVQTVACSGRVQRDGETGRPSSQRAPVAVQRRRVPDGGKPERARLCREQIVGRRRCPRPARSARAWPPRPSPAGPQGVPPPGHNPSPVTSAEREIAARLRAHEIFEWRRVPRPPSSIRPRDGDSRRGMKTRSWDYAKTRRPVPGKVESRRARAESGQRPAPPSRRRPASRDHGTVLLARGVRLSWPVVRYPLSGSDTGRDRFRPHVVVVAERLDAVRWG